MSTATSGSGASRRTLWVTVLVIGVVAVVAVVVAVVANDSGNNAPEAIASTASVPPATGSVPSTRWSPPAGLAKLIPGAYVATVDGHVVAVGANGSVTPLLREVNRYALVLAGAAPPVVAGGQFLVGTTPWEAMVADAKSVRFGEVLPSGIKLIPDASNGVASDFGPVGPNAALHHLTFPDGAQPVAQLRNGYLLVDTNHTALLEQRATVPAQRIGTGPARVLALTNDVVAWDNSSDGTVHVTNLATHRTVDIHAPGTAVTARLAPDGKRLAILSLADGESTVVADVASGRIVTSIPTAHANSAIRQLRAAPPALQPSPFSWDPTTGNLVVITTTGAAPAVTIVDANGAVKHTGPAPAGLSQLVPLR